MIELLAERDSPFKLRPRLAAESFLLQHLT